MAEPNTDKPPKKNTETENELIWNRIAEKLTELVGEDAFSRWFSKASLKELTQTTALVVLPSDMHQVWVEMNFMPELQSAVNSQLENCIVSVAIDGEDLYEESSEDASEQRKTKQEVLAQQQILEKKLKTVGLNPQFSFSRFVVGNNNEFAHAACSAVASNNGGKFNPLFIHGGPGLGKTHLMQSIGHSVLESQPSAKVVYLTSEKFTNEFIESVQKGGLDKFRKKYRQADIFLIDDIQFLAAKEKSQEEFFHTFNTLLDMQCQVVLTSDRPACEIQKLEPRLVSRFESGLTVQMEMPRFETRVAILNRKMEDWDAKLPEEIVHFLAERISSNVRRLEGGLVRLATYASLVGGDVTLAMAEDQLRDILREEGAKKVTIDTIQKQVAEHFDVRLADMTSRRRPANIAHARQVAMYLSRKLTNTSLSEIGEAFGGRDHGTVIHAVKKVEQQMNKDSKVSDTVDLLGSMLQH